jgi:hypothetical protein
VQVRHHQHHHPRANRPSIFSKNEKYVKKMDAIKKRTFRDDHNNDDNSNSTNNSRQEEETSEQQHDNHSSGPAASESEVNLDDVDHLLENLDADKDFQCWASFHGSMMRRSEMQDNNDDNEKLSTLRESSETPNEVMLESVDIQK